MKALKIVVGSIVALIVLLVAIGAVLPNNSHVERSIVVDARPATAYAVLNGFQQFRKWSPWEGLDPNTKYETSGPIWGVGAKQAWSSSNPNVGTGSQEITASVPNQSVTIKLVFSDFNSENSATYLLAPEGEGVKITWTNDTVFGDLVGRYFGLMMDKMIGKDYELGLSQLKTLLESLPKDDFSGIDLQVVETQAAPILYLADSAAATEAATKLGVAYGQIGGFMQANGFKQVGAPMAITRRFDDATGFWEFDAAIPVDKREPVPPADSPVKAAMSYSGWAVRATHTGPYENMEPSYAKLIAFKTAAGFGDNGNSWEHYVVDPTTVAPEQIKTDIYWPIK